MLGIICHFVDKSFKARLIILGMRRLFGPHSGQNMAQLLNRCIANAFTANKPLKKKKVAQVN